VAGFPHPTALASAQNDCTGSCWGRAAYRALGTDSHGDRVAAAVRGREELIGEPARAKITGSSGSASQPVRADSSTCGGASTTTGRAHCRAYSADPVMSAWGQKRTCSSSRRVFAFSAISDVVRQHQRTELPV